MIDVSVRLRRAVRLNDLLLVQRIVRNNPDVLRNPDFDDQSNTSLHLAARAGFLDIVAFLVDAGHESEGISRNTDHDTPLIMAAKAGRVDVGMLLIARFPRAVPYVNLRGMDALMASAQNGTHNLIPLLTGASYPCSPHARDTNGDTALHHAAAAGELKAARALLLAGASPAAQNAFAWTPLAYARTHAAKLYLEELVGELERRREDAARGRREDAARSSLRAKGSSVRLVTAVDEGVVAGVSPGLGLGLVGAGSGNGNGNAAGGGGSGGGAMLRGIKEEEDGIVEAGMPLPPLRPPPLMVRSAGGVNGGSGGSDWSPVESRRPMTPRGMSTEQRHSREWGYGAYGRARAHSGD
ncbi:uncharacterized protein K452DRAFT_293858 [Aplosporella prunicola CBS 121167]|uniref:Uncharacterized protein n=1 Tax=Aplosporella prunicola CBS 121167 TaxID=1176127 RepID=A0A6A6BTM6_9PEZI|nr:uncharacterized protein K452DRAFT_293858 [Aplosporella prunicola CBS 121167]KAF2147436.1 hypothetical protein K452DRAFT_293858 [Aplosporella prunicola CBS 121167]